MCNSRFFMISFRALAAVLLVSTFAVAQGDVRRRTVAITYLRDPVEVLKVAQPGTFVARNEMASPSGSAAVGVNE